MKDRNVTLKTKKSVLIGGGVLLLLVVAVLFSYREMSSMRRDLYGVRADYYGLNEDGTIDEESLTPNFDIVSQKVVSMRINDDDATAGQPQDAMWTQLYKTAKVRVVEVKITNDTETTYGYYENLGYTDENGVVKRAAIVHPDDNKNTLIKNYASLELAPGGTATVFIYFLDDGKEIKQLYTSDVGMEV